MKKITLVTIALAAAALTGCEESKSSQNGPEGPLHPWAEEAQAQIPDVMTLHTRVIARTCSPNGGVCHNGKEYPDLHTPGNFVTSVSRPCNMDLVDEPETVFDGCEPEADVLKAGSFKTKVALLGAEYYDPNTGNFGRPITLAEPAPETYAGDDVTFERNGSTLLTANGVLYVNEGDTYGWLNNLYNLDYPTYLALMGVTGGDPNGNGVFGAEDAWEEVMPGRPEKSYLWARITGTVPGTRMPLANQPLSNAEYVAVACWIETIGNSAKVDEKIDYDGCWYARTPTDYEWTPEL